MEQKDRNEKPILVNLKINNGDKPKIIKGFLKLNNLNKNWVWFKLYSKDKKDTGSVLINSNHIIDISSKQFTNKKGKH